MTFWLRWMVGLIHIFSSSNCNTIMIVWYKYTYNNYNFAGNWANSCYLATWGQKSLWSQGVRLPCIPINWSRLVLLCRKRVAFHWWPWTGDGVAEKLLLSRYYSPHLKIWSLNVVDLDTDKAWGTIPINGIYFKLQPLAEGGFFRFFSYISKFILPGLMPL